MDMVLVESSNIHSIGWSETGPTLRVEFHTKGKAGEAAAEAQPRRVYDYEDVPESVWREFMQSPSKGAYFARMIKGRYPTRRIQ